MSSKYHYILILSLFVSTCFAQKPLERKVKVLFVGNSLTYTNNLPNLVQKKAKENRIDLEVAMMAFPNYALIDHWEDGKVQQMIREEAYDYVFIQQGPSSQPYGREVLFTYGKKFKDLCQTHNSELVFFMVWPSQTYYHIFEAVIRNHEDAAKAINVVVCPVGRIWKDHFDKTKDFSYYGSDGFHPSLKGSLAAAEILVNCLF